MTPAGHLPHSGPDRAGALPLDVEPLTDAALALARRFSAGARLLTVGLGPCEDDARHVAVEFLHPVIVGKRALPSLLLPRNARLSLLGTGNDVLLLLDRGGTESRATELLAEAGHLGLLRIVLGDARTVAEAEHLVRVASDDPLRARELHVSAYHVLWELVHIFREHPVLDGSLS